MKVALAIEFLKSKSLKRKLAEMKEVKELILMQSQGMLSDKDIEEGWTREADLHINIDEIFFDIDGMNFTDWCVKHFEVGMLSDKSITLLGLKT